MDFNFGNNIRRRESIHSTSAQESKEFKERSFMIEKFLYVLLPYLHIKWNFRLYYFLFQVIFFSLFGFGGEKLLALKILVGKNSIFNQVFVKFGWGWTFSLILFLRLSCMPLHCNWKQHLKNLLIRLSSLTLFFYLFCQVFFPFIEEQTGRCVKQGIILDENIDKIRCLKKGYDFYSFDISGHSYLMIYCILTLMEESKELIYVLSLGQFFQKSTSLDNDVSTSSFSEHEVQTLEKKYLFILPFIAFFSLCIFSLSLLWDMMLIITTLYYHTLIEKLLGNLLAIIMWYLQYRVYFQPLKIL